MKPSIGRIVHVRGTKGKCLPAIICNVTPTISCGEVLYVLDVCAFDIAQGAQGLDAVGPMDWHWPEREKD